MTAQTLANILGVSVATVSAVLRSLRQLDLVRYEVKWRQRVYWIKYEEISSITAQLEKLVDKIGVKEPEGDHFVN